MAYTIERLADLPVLISTYTGELTAEELLQSQYDLMKQGQGFDAPQKYLVINATGANVAFGEALNNMRTFGAMRRDADGDMPEERIVLVFVGTMSYLNIFSGMFQNERYGGFEVLRFDTLEVAQQNILIRLGQPDTE